MVFRKAKSVPLHLLDQILTGDFHFHWGADGKFFLVKVDHDDLAAGFQHLFYEREILGLIVLPEAAGHQDRQELKQHWSLLILGCVD